jgi:predicted metal-dependent hydrolase
MAQKLSLRERALCFRRGVEEFNAGHFFEAHESWETIWLEAAEPDKTFLQGITQVAAAFHHAERSNRQGATSLLKKGLRKLEQFPNNYRGLQLEKLRKALQEWAKALEEKRDRRDVERPRIESEDQAGQKKRG